MMMHAFSGNLPVAVKRIAAKGDTLPVRVATTGPGGSVHPLPVYGRPNPASLVHALTGGRSGDSVSEEDRIFSVTGTCTSCGACMAACPAGNIEMVGKIPAWNNHCQLCLACIRTCPAQAIRVGDKKPVGCSHGKPE
jgi:ferredoxin